MGNSPIFHHSDRGDRNSAWDHVGEMGEITTEILYFLRSVSTKNLLFQTKIFFHQKFFVKRTMLWGTIFVGTVFNRVLFELCLVPWGNSEHPTHAPLAGAFMALGPPLVGTYAFGNRCAPIWAPRHPGPEPQASLAGTPPPLRAPQKGAPLTEPPYSAPEWRRNVI